MVIFSTTENNMIHAYIYIHAHLEILQIRETYPKDLKVAELGFCERQGDININCKRKTKGKSFALCHLCFWDWLVLRTLLQPCSIRILEIVKDMM